MIKSNQLIASKQKAASENISSDSKNFSDDNNFYLYGLFDESLGRKVIPNVIREVEEQARLKEGIIRFFIDSNGGDTRYLWTLVSLIEKAKKLGVRVETHVYGVAYSCGSMLACAGTKGHRYVGENAEHLCHLGSGYFGATNDIELERESSALKAHFDKVRKAYKKYAKIKDLDKVIMNDSLFIRGKNMITQGLADKFID